MLSNPRTYLAGCVFTLLWTALAACSPRPEGGSLAPRDSATLASGSVKIPPLAEPFDSTGCIFHYAVYRPHPDWERRSETFRYTLKIGPPREHGGFYEAQLVFEAYNRSSGALMTTFRMNHTTGNGLARHTAFTPGDALSVDVQHINRDLGFEAQGTTPRLQIPASYAMLFTDLQRELYYRHGRWEDLAGAVTFHTPSQAKPEFPNLWVLSQCGRPVRRAGEAAP